MTQFYPDGMCDVNLGKAREGGGITTPPPEDFDTEAMQGSMQQILSENLGLYVVCEFVVGTQAMARKEGLLYSVGRSFVVLYEETIQTFTVCDIFSIKFVTFYLPGQRPGRTGQSNVPMVSVPGYGGVPAGNYGLGAGAPARVVPPREGVSTTGSRTMGSAR